MSRQPVITIPGYQAALSNVGSQKVTVAFLGTSTTQGANATLYTARYVQNLAGRVGRRYAGVVDNGYAQYFSPQADPTSFVYANPNTPTYLLEGLSLRTVSMPAAQTMTWAPYCSAFTLYFVQGASYQPFTLTVDGNPVVVPFDTSRAGDHHDGQVTVTGLSYGPHTLVITAPTGGAKITGYMVYNYASADVTKGVHFYNSGHGGVTTTEFVGQTGLYERLGSLSPQLVMMMPGTNDYGASMDITLYTSNVTSMISSIKAAVPGVGILVVTPYRRLDFIAPIPWSNYEQANRTVAAANNCWYVNLTNFYPATPELDSQDFIDTDNLHQTNAGHNYMAGLLLPAFI